MKTYWIRILTSAPKVRALRAYFLALVFALSGLGTEMAYASATDVPETYMGDTAKTSANSLGDLGKYLVNLTNKTFMIGLLVMLLAGIAGCILWAFGQRGIVMNVLGGVVLLALIVMVIGLVADTAANGS